MFSHWEQFFESAQRKRREINIEILVPIASAEAQASLHTWADFQEPLLIIHTNAQRKIRLLALLDMPAWVYVRGICEKYHADPNMYK